MGSPQNKGKQGNDTPTPIVMPDYNAFSMSPSVAAGVPILELVRKFEEERLLTREDRIALNDALYNPVRRDGIVKALRDLELGDGSRFAVRRLKALIHQNGIGEVTSSQYKQKNQMLNKGGGGGGGDEHYTATSQGDVKQEGSAADAAGTADGEARLSILTSDEQEPSSGSAPKSTARSPKGIPKVAQSSSGSPGRRHQDDERSVASSMGGTQDAIVQLVGACPVYWGPDNFNICNKITKRLRDFLVKMKQAPSQGKRRFCVLVGEGSMNPLTRMHLRSYFVAKQYLEAQAGFIVLGSLLSPSHGMKVRERYRTHPAEIIPSPHRLAIAQLMVQESKWLSIDPWEITRRRPMDYLSLLQHTHDTLSNYFPSIEIKVVYLCKHNAVPLLSQSSLRAENFGVVCPCRATEFDSLKKSLGAKWNGIMWLVEDTAVLDASMDVVTSRKVRDSMRAYRSTENLVGTAIDLYVQQNHIGAKMNGEEEWTDEDKKMPLCAARPLNLTLKSQSGASGLSVSGLTTPAFTPAITPTYTPSWQQQRQQPSPNSAPPKQFQADSLLEVDLNDETNDETGAISM